MSENFATRGQFTYIVNMPFLLRQIWNIVYYFLPEFTRRNIIEVSSKQIKQGKLREFIHPDVLEQKYGGNKANIVTFFPPDMRMPGEALMIKREVLK